MMMTTWPYRWLVLAVLGGAMATGCGAAPDETAAHADPAAEAEAATTLSAVFEVRATE
jgi:hypothetical protein